MEPLAIQTAPPRSKLVPASRRYKHEVRDAKGTSFVGFPTRSLQATLLRRPHRHTATTLLLRDSMLTTPARMSPRLPLGAVDGNSIRSARESPAAARKRASHGSGGLQLELRDDAPCDSSLMDVSICTVDTPALDQGAWTPSADVGAALVAKAQSKLHQQCGAWTPSAASALGSDAVARAEARLADRKAAASPATQHIKAIGSEDEDLSRALRNFRAKRSQSERSISWASRLPLSASISNVLSELELAFSTMRVWKVVDAEGDTHLISLRHFSQSSELHVDGSLAVTAARSMWTTAADSLVLPFEVNGVAGTIKMGKDSMYECVVDGEIMPEDAQSLPPSSQIQHISVPRYEIREGSDGNQHVAFEVHCFTRQAGAVEDTPCERAEGFKRFSQFQTLQAQLKSAQAHTQSEQGPRSALPVRHFCTLSCTCAVPTPASNTLYRLLTDWRLFSTAQSLPSKTCVRRFGHGFLEERRVQLQQYLDGLLKLPGVSYNPDFLNFLGLM